MYTNFVIHVVENRCVWNKMNLSECSVCTDPEAKDNRVLHCGCGVSVHMMCYGVAKFAKKWKCSPCKAGIFSVKCELCLKVQGAFKKTVCGNWVHVICALFTDGVFFIDKNAMQPIDISEPLAKKGSEQCEFCYRKIGVCCSCAQTDCDTPIHITCAQSYNCLLEQTHPKNKTIAFLAFCIDHKPIGYNRRISSNFVRERLSEKHKGNTVEKSVIDAEFHPIASSTLCESEGEFNDLKMRSSAGDKDKV